MLSQIKVLLLLIEIKKLESEKFRYEATTNWIVLFTGFEHFFHDRNTLEYEVKIRASESFGLVWMRIIQNSQFN